MLEAGIDEDRPCLLGIHGVAPYQGQVGVGPIAMCLGLGGTENLLEGPGHPLPMVLHGSFQGLPLINTHA